MHRIRTHGRQVAILLAVGIHTLLLIWGTFRQSPTCDELRHLVAGVSNWKLGRFSVYRLNPPLTRLVAALPVLAAQPKTNWEHYSEAGGWAVDFALERDFTHANGTRTLDLCRIGRLACIPFSWLGAFICLRWAAELYGANAGFLALLLWCFCPNIIAHSQLITCDVAATALGLSATYCFWRWLKAPGWGMTFAAGTVLGLAVVTKFTWLLLFLLLTGLWLIGRVCVGRFCGNVRACAREAVQLVVMMMFAVYIINVVYAFEGSFQRLGEFPFVSRSLAETPGGDAEVVSGQHAGNRFTGGWLQNVPVPLPRNFDLGFDDLSMELEVVKRPSYLHGEFRVDGWWYYYVYAAAIKVPIGSWLLFILALGTPFAVTQRWPAWRNTTMIVAPMIVLIALVSFQTGRMSNFRFALPAFPYWFIFTSRAARIFESRNRSLKAISTVALTWSITSSFWIYPHSLSYFNEIVGGPHHGSAHLLGSNIDWGQDLLFLRDWVHQHPDAKPLRVTYYGACEPKYIGLPADIEPTEDALDGAPAEEPHSYWYACSLNYVFWSAGGTAQSTTGHVPRLYHPDRPPDRKAGYSIWLWRMSRTEN